MGHIQKTVFISYRRKDIFVAYSIYQNLTQNGYDVFFDYVSLGSGDFEQIIANNIKSHAHFILVLTPGALDKCIDPNDWLRREVETAIEQKRNIVPLLLFNFDFYMEDVKKILRTSNLEKLGHYNGWPVETHNIDGAMEIVRNRFLNIPLDAVIHPRSDIADQNSKALQESLRDLQRRDERQKELIYLSMSALTSQHSFISLVYVIRTYVEMIKLGLQTWHQEGISELQQTADKALLFIDKVLKQELYPQEIEMVVEDFVQYISDRSENFFNTIPDKINFMLDVSVIRLYRDHTLIINLPIFLNGVLYTIFANSVNALKDNLDNKVVALRIFTDIINSQPFLNIEIRDNGIGIPNELQEQVFKLPVTSKNGKGIGLLLANTVVEKAGGTISIHSKEETTVTIKMPIFTKENVDG